MKHIIVILVIIFSVSIAAAQQPFFKKGKEDSTGIKKKPLYILNGLEISIDELKKINSGDIEKVNILKDSTAFNKYGNKGINGVVEIVLKKSTNTAPKKNNEEGGEPPVFTKVEVGAYYKGDIKKFIQDNLQQQKDKDGNTLTGKISLQFIVTINGHISDIKVDDRSECKTEQLVTEAKRVMELTNGNWVGAEQNGRKLEKAFHYQNIEFK